MIEYRSTQDITGPLMFVKVEHPVRYGEIVEITKENGEKVKGQVLEARSNIAVIQVFGSTINLNRNATIAFTGEPMLFGVSDEVLGKTFDGFGRPLDGSIIRAELKLNVNGEPINPFSRRPPNDFIETGISTIDVMNTLVRGQKLPIFSGAGLPHNDLAAQIARQANVKGENFAVVFAAVGITYDEAFFFRKDFERTGAIDRSVLFLNLANDPAIERLLTPRLALTVAEYLAFYKDMHVLVIITDMTNYAEALREISGARREIPGRRGYPGYMYTDFATIYERAGIVVGKKGSVTQIPILTMPSDDRTHPIPDLTGYITEGQIVISRELNRKNLYPAIDPLPSLSRLMNNGIGKNKTREDHKNVSNQLYAAYANGRDLRALASVVGEDSLTENDRKYLKFADLFENRFIAQGKNERRDIEKSLELGWELLSILPESELKKVKPEEIERYLRKYVKG